MIKGLGTYMYNNKVETTVAVVCVALYILMLTF